jgi:hypothetical protein
MNIEEIKAATPTDLTLQEVCQRVRNNSWHLDIPEEVDAHMLNLFRHTRDELTISLDNDLILRGNKLVIPTSLQARILSLAHEGHLGVVKTKQLLREKVWFPRIDYKVDQLIKNCLACQSATVEKKPKEASIRTPLPAGPWQEISIDFWGPTPDGNYAVVFIDYSRYPVVEISRAISAEFVLPILDKVFTTFGIPLVCKTDNGPPFTSQQFKLFCDQMGMKHR